MKWTCLSPGDFKLPADRQNPKKIPPPRIGARMVLVEETKIYVHNGHDNENEKLSDMWCFDLTKN